MSYVIIPLQPLPNQAFSCVLDGLRADIAIRTTDFGLFADVRYDGQPVALSRLCEDRTDINPNRYLGLAQFLGFVDTQGLSDPVFASFSSRYLLIYGDAPETFAEPLAEQLPQGSGYGFTYGNDYGGTPP